MIKFLCYSLLFVMYNAQVTLSAPVSSEEEIPQVKPPQLSSPPQNNLPTFETMQEKLLWEQNLLLKQMLLQEQQGVLKSYWQAFVEKTAEYYTDYGPTTENLTALSETTGAHLQKFGGYLTGDEAIGGRTGGVIGGNGLQTVQR